MGEYKIEKRWVCKTCGCQQRDDFSIMNRCYHCGSINIVRHTPSEEQILVY